VNVIAPIMTNSNGLYRQTIYFPYSWALHYGRGAVLDISVEAPTTYELAKIGTVPHLDIVGTFDNSNGATALFILNRDLQNARQFEVEWEASTPGALQNAWVITGDDLKAVNGFDAPDRVKPRAADKPSTTGGRTRVEVPAKSYTVLQWGGK